MPDSLPHCRGRIDALNRALAELREARTLDDGLCAVFDLLTAAVRELAELQKDCPPVRGLLIDVKG